MRTIFFVDDDGLMREMVTRLLEKNSYRVRSFRSPIDALPLIDIGYPDVLVSDVQMPGMSGLEFARRVRERVDTLPVILLTGYLTPEVEREARDLGVLHVFQKPIKNVSRLRSVIRAAIAKREEDDALVGFDQLRLSFLTGLAHQLRTPLTAIKLAIDSLFAAQTAGFPRAEGRLLAIGQRNIDRIIRLVEGQLGLLQITLGDVSVARRLVVLRDVVERAVGGISPTARKSLIVEDAGCDHPIYFFSDPDRLCAVIQYVLENGAYERADGLRLHAPMLDSDGNVLLEFENTSLSGGRGRAIGVNPNGTGQPGGVGGPSNLAVQDFETRAFRRLVESLLGEMHVDDGMPERVQLTIPLVPPFDDETDLVAPINGLREAAVLSGKSVTVLKCDVRREKTNGSIFSVPELHFFQRCLSVLSDGEALVRGENEGRYHVVIIGRTPEEIEQIVDFLGAGEDCDKEIGVETELLESNSADHERSDPLLLDLETVQ
ncbi:MAG: hybrid sensor histidine kinase/response regulator [Candidatus Latescibacterota bacterium]|nr:MAG: hybrid sensor histidine kinase/response regulator [Candidatus Latescibacterota bacterium]